jgi:glutathione S-transferase
MRAHMALKNADIKVELREVVLKDMPEQLLALSPDATVPVLLLPDDEVITESWDIVKWALSQNGSSNWLGSNNEYSLDAEMLIETNDYSFKMNLDHYKYADRYPENSQEYYRTACEEFIEELEDMLTGREYLLADAISLADIGVFPFIRQFSLVDKDWFEQSRYSAVRHWLQGLTDSDLFQHIFQKHQPWQKGAEITFI